MTVRRARGFSEAEAASPVGHRQRLRERLLDGGEAALADYELLEFLLFHAHARGDTKPLAKRLIARFGSFPAVLAADPERLKEVEGVGDAAVAALRAVRLAALKLLQSQVIGRPAIASWTALVDYLTAAMSHDANESFRVLYLDRKNTLIADEVQQRGTVDHTPVYPREVVKRALELGSTALMLVHNHPWGDPTPSRADIDMTKQVVRAGEALGIVVHDHVVIGRGRHVSFRAQGLL